MYISFGEEGKKKTKNTANTALKIAKYMDIVFFLIRPLKLGYTQILSILVCNPEHKGHWPIHAWHTYFVTMQTLRSKVLVLYSV